MYTKSLTLKKISELLGLSETTISRVLNGKAEQYRISVKTADLVREKAGELGYVPNPLAQSLRLQKTNTLGLVIPDIANPYFAGIAHHIETEARKQGYSIILCDTEERTDLEKDALDLLKLRQVDGLILSPVGNDSRHIETHYQSGLPVVIIDRCFPDLPVPFVSSDNYNGAYKAVEYLVKAGHRHIGCIQGLPFASPNRDRVLAFRQVHSDHHLMLNEQYITGNNFGQENGYLGTLQLLEQNPQITAIFAVSNLIALGSLRAIAEKGKQVPGDVSIVAFDDQPYFNYLSAPMCAVKQNIAQMGKTALQLLLEQIDNPDSKDQQSVLIPTELIIRNSVRPVYENI